MHRIFLGPLEGSMAEIKSKFLDIGAKVLCIAVLILQMVLLDYIFIKLDKNVSAAGRYIWIGLDIVILIVWIVSLIWSHRYFKNLGSTRKRIPEDAGSLIKRALKAAIAELPFAYVSWLLYSSVLVAKILRMFYAMDPVGFGEGLQRDENRPLMSPTGIKIVLSFAGIIFGLLAYSHHNEVQNTKYKLIIEKLAHSASLDVLDCLMLLSYLFIVDDRLILPYPMDRAIKTFACLCILLPVFPLFTLRYISTRQDEKTFQMVLALNSALYLFFVNIPLFAIRIVLWTRHDADVTTFLTKNVMAIVRGMADIYLDVSSWWHDKKNKEKPEQTDSALGSEEKVGDEDGETVEMNKVTEPARV